MRWDQTEIEIMIQMYNDFYKVKFIAKFLNRPIANVYSQISYLVRKGELRRHGIGSRWQNRKKMWGFVNPPLPNHTLIHENGKVIKRYPPGFANGVWPEKDVR